MSKKREGTKGEYAKHLRKYGKRTANKGNRRYHKSLIKKDF
jgi:hypothetical protein